MSSPSEPARFKTFRVGPKNKRLMDEGEGEAADGSGYEVVVETDVAPEVLAARHGIEIRVEDAGMAAAMVKYANEGKALRHFELFEFPQRADYGRNGADESFVRERLKFFGFRPATFIELLCFGGHLRERHKYDWFEGKGIVALGSVALTTHVLKKRFLFWKGVTATYRHYPEFVCVAGRPVDQIVLTSTDKNRKGNWPNETLFLGVDLK
jgi:hypothetical protein